MQFALLISLMVMSGEDSVPSVAGVNKPVDALPAVALEAIAPQSAVSQDVKTQAVEPQSGAAQTVSKANQSKPNVVLIYCDDLGYTDVGCFGSKDFATPNLDRLAGSGIKLTNFYVAQAVCSASRAALLTGCYPNRVGILGALSGKNHFGIAASEWTMAEMFKSVGYRTAIFGKWHLGHHQQFLPAKHGFDRYFGLPYSNDMLPARGYAPLPLIDGTTVVETDPDQSSLTVQGTNRAIKFIADSHADQQPFFVYLPYSMPHVPLATTKPFEGKSKYGRYGDVIAELDFSVGRILRQLDELGLAQNTLVIFASDNGPWLPYGTHAGTRGSLREGKGTAFEGGVRVPFIARLPGKIKPGTVCNQPAMTIDLLPTLARLVSGKLGPHKIDGLDISKLLFGDGTAKSPHDALYFYWGPELHAVRSGPWKLHFPHAFRQLVDAPPATDGGRIKELQGQIEESLFHLEQDVGERINLAHQHPDVVKQLEALADRMRADLGDALRRIPNKNGRPHDVYKVANNEQ